MPAHAEFECTRCGATARAAGAMSAVFHPAVQGFLYDHGFDLRANPSWTFEPVTLPSATLHSEEPLELAVSFEYGDDSITAIVGSDTQVRAVDRDRRST